jgi:uncharacterized protein YggE
MKNQNNDLWKYAALMLAFCLLLLIFMRPVPGKAAQVNLSAGTEQDNTAERTITVTGSADVMVAPDEVDITVGIETRNENFQKAKSENDRGSKKVIELAGEFGIEPKYVQSDYIKTYPCYEYEKYTQTSRVSYYVVQKRIIIKLKDIEKFERFISELSDSGTAMIQKIEFLSTELSKYRNEARKLAARAAMDKARLIAREVGSDIGKVITINEEKVSNYVWYDSWWGGSSYGGYDQLSLASNVLVNYQDAPGSSDSEEMGETISIGQIKITAKIGMIFELK